jgi:hypothetical protein
MTITLQTLLQKLDTLPSEQRQPAIDFVDFLAPKYTQPTPTQPRILGLNKGEIRMSEDFDAPLSDDFWLGSHDTCDEP